MFSARWAHRPYCGSDYHFLPLNRVLRTRIRLNSPPTTCQTAICHNFFRRPGPSWQIRTRTEDVIDTLTGRAPLRYNKAVAMWPWRIFARTRQGWIFESLTLNNIYSPERGTLGLSLRWRGCLYIRCFDKVSAKKGIYTRLFHVSTFLGQSLCCKTTTSARPQFWYSLILLGPADPNKPNKRPGTKFTVHRDISHQLAIWCVSSGHIPEASAMVMLRLAMRRKIHKRRTIPTVHAYRIYPLEITPRSRTRGFSR